MNYKYVTIFRKSILRYVALVSCIASSGAYASNDKIMSPRLDGYKVLEFAHDSSKKISTNLGTKSQTRISFAPYSIRELVGDSNKYKIIHDSLGSSIFIIPKVSSGEKIELTIITSGGKTQDFSFDVKNEEGSVILIKQSQVQNDANSTVNIEAKDMLKSMSKRLAGKYFITDISGTNNRQQHRCINQKNVRSKGVPITCGGYFEMPKELEGLEIKETHIYNYRIANIKGIVLEIINNTKNPISINERNLSNIFKNSILTSLDTKTLQPQAFTRGFVVLYLGKED